MPRASLALGAACLLLAVGVVPAAGQGARAEPVGQEEQQVYEAVLDSWLDSDVSDQLVDEDLGPPPAPSDPSNADCVAGSKFPRKPAGAEPKKTLAGAKFRRPGVQLIDGEKWHADDPEDHMATDGVAPAVEQGLNHSLITFSQVSFSKDGRDALVEFSMACGRLCGTGFTLRMHKANGVWKTAKRCGGFIS